MQIKDALIIGRNLLSQYKISNSHFESRALLAHVINQSQEYILFYSDRLLLSSDYNQFLHLIKLRTKYLPLAHLVGYKEFYSRNFIVDNSVLIPRPDSETLIDAVVRDYSKIANYQTSIPINILELGVGSGCLIITLLLELKNAIGVGVDISMSALNIAHRNCQKYKLINSLKLLQSNWFSKLVLGEKYDIIIANPPYISNSELNMLSRETLLYEPHIALFSSNNGLQSYQKIVPFISSFLNQNGRLYLECSYNKAEIISNICLKNGLILENKYYDLNGYCRCLKFKLQ
ncbi:protein-(glutamine-N5) methyltransferase, release factor-specific [Orientia chuto str. Dubai]|uniref:peptide chain release factor N(5)-glutamine methyltransferase n=1 Tax=Orientia chuto str. Dubai TaxID=1359168 RepID=A0A0F3MR51_9RICK|nr:peptide chain release factor N(5)-glutamine methyltransferase [Candidatus Orientia mediorientalis]KJV57064.1 protein-(glutamine-N5) methyltransferase, release factor-specific [Orientia chuto str. Dubai]